MIVSMAVTVVVVVLIAAVIAIMIMVPFVAVFDAAMRAFPIAVVEAPSIVARADPTRTFIGWAAPIAFMPTIMS